MSVRILHCSTNINNYNICVEKQICGFGNRGPKSGDLIYLAVRANGKTLCGARCILTTVTDENPWNDGKDYANIMRAEKFEFCNPFDISILRTVGGNSWGMIYTQASKEIKDGNAINLLNDTFTSNKTSDFIIIDVKKEDEEEISQSQTTDFIDTIDDPEEAEKIKEQYPDTEVKIMGTFQTIHFSTETDQIQGLEKHVNDNFYSLFTEFEDARTILIPENRMFMTGGKKTDEGKDIKGIRSIPDALLIKFDPKMSSPIKVYLIEYECYGQNKTNSMQKSRYLNSVIIPQLMRFAAGFSTTTDYETRDKTTQDWLQKIKEYISTQKELYEKTITWMTEQNRDILAGMEFSLFSDKLADAFKKNISVVLIIDELTREQKDTINNIINAFKLDDGTPIGFDGYVINLVQRINLKNADAEYALTVRK